MSGKFANLLTKNRTCILAIVVLGFIVRIIVASSAPVFLDESYYAYQGALLLKGQIPFVNFYGYPPVPLLGIAAFTFLLGHSIVIARASSVVFDSATIYLVYLIAKDFFDTRVGLLSALFYSITPFTVWLGTVANEMPTTVFLIMFSFLLFERFTERSKKHLLMSGAIIGIGYFASRTVLVLGIVFLAYYLVILFRRQINFIAFLKNYGSLVIGSLLVVIPIYLFFLTKLSFSQIDLLYGFAGTSLPSPIPVMTTQINLRVLNQTLVQGLELYIPASFYLIITFTLFFRKRLLRMLFSLVPAAILLYLLIVPQDLPPYVNYGVVPLYSHLFNLVDVLGASLILTSVVIFLLPRSFNPPYSHIKNKLVLLFLLVSIIIGFYEYFGWSTGALSTYYLWETVAVCAIMAGAWSSLVIDRIHTKGSSNRKTSNSIKLVAVCSLCIVVASGFVNYYSYSNSYTGERPYPVSLVDAAAKYVASYTNSQSTIFSEPIFAYLSDRSDILNFYTLTLEYTRGGPLPGIPAGEIPTSDGFIHLLQRYNVDYVIFDVRLYNVISDYLPTTYQYINTFYSPIKSFVTNYSQYSLGGNGQPYPITVLNRSSVWSPSAFPGYLPYVQAGAVTQPSGDPTVNYTYSSNMQGFMRGNLTSMTVSGSTFEFPASSNMSSFSYLQMTMPDNPYPSLELFYSVSNSNCTSGSDYVVLLETQGQWHQIYIGPLYSNYQHSTSINLTAFLGETLSARIVPYSNSSSCIPSFGTTALFESHDPSLIAQPAIVALSSVYDSRLDLQNSFPGALSGNETSFLGLINWANGVVNHVFYDGSFETLKPYAWYYTLMATYNSRKDLQETYTNPYYNETNSNKLFCWANNVVSGQVLNQSYSTLNQYASSYKTAC